MEYKNDPLFWLLLYSANTGGKIGTILDCLHLEVNLKIFIYMLTLLSKGVQTKELKLFRFFPFATDVNDTGGAP